MTGFEPNKHDSTPNGGPAERSDALPFRVELWRTGGEVERVLGLASNAALARAIFHAAISENPGKRVTLRRGEQILDESPG
jgi:hypothetical protein